MKNANPSYSSSTQLYVTGNEPASGSLVQLQIAKDRALPPKPAEEALQELKECQANKQPVWAFVYKQSPVGYFATYFGHICFIPLELCGFTYTPHSQPKDLTGTWQQVEVINVTDDGKIVVAIDI